MKKLLILTLNILLISVAAIAQKIKVTEKSENLGGGKHNALSVTIYEADDKTIDKEWKSLLKKYNAKITTLGSDQFGDNAVIKEISNNTIDVYWRLEKSTDGYKLTAAYDLGGAFLSSSQHSKEYRVLETIMYDFALDITRKAVMAQQKEAQRELEKRDRKLKGLVSTNEDLHKDVEAYKARIKKAEDDIALNLQSQTEAKASLDQQNKILEAIKEKAKRFE